MTVTHIWQLLFLHCESCVAVQNKRCDSCVWGTHARMRTHTNTCLCTMSTSAGECMQNKSGDLTWLDADVDVTFPMSSFAINNDLELIMPHCQLQYTHKHTHTHTHTHTFS